MENVNKQLLDALKELVSIVDIHSDATDNNFAWAELSCARQAIAAAEQAQQAEPVGYVAPDELPGLKNGVCAFVYPQPDRHATQPVFAQPPAVAVPGAMRKIGTLPVKDRYFLCCCEKCGWLGSSEECRESINHMYGDGDYYCPACGANGPDEMASAEATFNAMLAAAQKGSQ